MAEGDDFSKHEERKRRRSSFFRRSLSTFGSESSTFDISTDSPSNTDQGKVVEIKDDNAIKYLNSLTEEIKGWKTLLHDKKKREEELSRKHSQAGLSTDYLTDEDKKFLADRPDYTAFGRLLDSVVESAATKEQRINNTFKKVENFFNHCESVREEVAGRVIDHFIESFDEFSSDDPPKS